MFFTNFIAAFLKENSSVLLGVSITDDGTVLKRLWMWRKWSRCSAVRIISTCQWQANTQHKSKTCPIAYCTLQKWSLMSLKTLATWQHHKHASTNLKSKLCEMSFLLDLTGVTHCKTNLCVVMKIELLYTCNVPLSSLTYVFCPCMYKN